MAEPVQEQEQEAAPGVGGEQEPPRMHVMVPAAPAAPADADAVAAWLRAAQPAYDQAVRLCCEDGPPERPFDPRYAGRAIMGQIGMELESIPTSGLPQELQDLVRDARLVVGYHGMRTLADTEETGEAERAADKLLAKLRPLGASSRLVTTFLMSLNTIGIIWAGRNEPQRALELLEEAQEVYTAYRSQPDAQPPFRPDRWVAAEAPDREEAAAWKQFESTNTHTLFFLAQCHGNAGNPEKSAQLCHLTLQRQLETADFEPVEWALNCAAMSQYYLTKGEFRQARHCLASASKIAEQAKPEAELEEQKLADVELCWVKYALGLLEASNALKSGELDSATSEQAEIVRFPLETSEGEVPLAPVKSYEEARPLFLLGQRRLKKAMEFYVLDGHVSDHVSCLQDWSRLYRLLAEMCDDPDIASKLNKRRLDMLTGILDQLNPQHFLAVCRQLIYEIAETSVCMMQLKTQRMEQRGKPDAKTVTKINKFVTLAIEFYQRFLDSMKDKDGKLPDPFEDIFVRSCLMAYFWMARLYTQFCEVDPNVIAQNYHRSIETYQLIVDYCDRHPEETCFLEETQICREMVELLPQKLQRFLST